MKVSNEHKAALVGHEHREEILAILASNPDYSSERSTGRVVGQQADNHGETDGVPEGEIYDCLLYTSPSPRDQRGSRMPSSA